MRLARRKRAASALCQNAWQAGKARTSCEWQDCTGQEVLTRCEGSGGTWLPTAVLLDREEVPYQFPITFTPHISTLGSCACHPAISNRTLHFLLVQQHFLAFSGLFCLSSVLFFFYFSLAPTPSLRTCPPHDDAPPSSHHGTATPAKWDSAAETYRTKLTKLPDDKTRKTRTAAK